MRRFKISLISAIALSLTCTSCIGSFSMFHKLEAWNETVGPKGINELVFIAFWVIPVYEVALLSDLIVLNSIEFWSGENPAAKGTRKIETENGVYLVKCDGKGYDIISKNDGTSLRLDFCVDTQTWSVLDSVTGESYELLTWVDSTHVSLPLGDGTSVITELSSQGLFAYRAALELNQRRLASL
ncbi:MAG: DUF3332 domain-containing protein [Muribaculaceae bacterium]|nr:DUF3332 domain-containing protein [Muribaculaceae bacterium]